jgi:hypothetical protein
MIIAFYGLALAMILGGLAALVQGYGIIVLERGWTLVIAGTVAAASGALLLGITAGLSRLRAIQAELARLREHFSRVDAPFPETLSALDPFAAVSSAEVARDTFGPDQGERGEEARHADRIAEPRRGAGPAQPFERTAPEVSFRLREREAPAGRDRSDPLADEALLFGSDGAEPKPDPFGRGAADRTGAGEEAEPRRDAKSAASEPPMVIGTYNSGGNRYTMYSDGSIEADTPDGHYRFSSLDELKAFIASGGESGPRSRVS